MSKYYAVVNGRNPGIYDNWNETYSNVKNYPNAIYRKFDTLLEAKNFLEQSRYNQKLPIYDHRTIPKDWVVAFTDGSFAKNQMGYGVVIFDSHHEKRLFGVVDPIFEYGRLKSSNNIAELYAILIAIENTEPDRKLIIYSDSLYSILMLSSNDQLKNDNANYELISKIFDSINGREIVFRHVDAHQDVEMNNIADQLANLGRELNF